MPGRTREDALRAYALAVTKNKVRYPQRYAGPGQSIIERVLFSAS